jgi:tetratricopeptide (TPR) repeat protein
LLCHFALLARAKVRLGIGAERRGDLEAAQREFEEAGEVFRALGDKEGLAACYGNQALILHAWGRLEEAMGLLKKQQALCEELGLVEGLATSLSNQAFILGLKLGRRQEALAKIQQALQLCQRAGLRALVEIAILSLCALLLCC